VSDEHSPLAHSFAPICKSGQGRCSPAARENCRPTQTEVRCKTRQESTEELTSFSRLFAAGMGLPISSAKSRLYEVFNSSPEAYTESHTFFPPLQGGIKCKADTSVCVTVTGVSDDDVVQSAMVESICANDGSDRQGKIKLRYVPGLPSRQFMMPETIEVPRSAPTI
jgi:hypothetical protein